MLRDLPMVHDLSLNAAGRVTSTKAVRADGASDPTRGIGLTSFPVIICRQIGCDPLNLRYIVPVSGAVRAVPCQSVRVPQRKQRPLLQPSARSSDPSPEFCKLRCTQSADGYVGVGFFEAFTGGGIGVLGSGNLEGADPGLCIHPKGLVVERRPVQLYCRLYRHQHKGRDYQLGPTNIIQGCYTSDDFPNDPLCDLFTRDTSGQNPSYKIMEVRDPYINVNKQLNKSIDFISRFSQDLGDKGMLS